MEEKDNSRKDKFKYIFIIAMYTIFGLVLFVSGISILIASAKIVNNIILFGTFEKDIYWLYLFSNIIGFIISVAIGTFLGLLGIFFIHTYVLDVDIKFKNK